MPDTEYAVFEALDPFFAVVQKGLKGLVDGEHYFDTIADDALFEFRYNFPGWPQTVRGRADQAVGFITAWQVRPPTGHSGPLGLIPRRPFCLSLKSSARDAEQKLLNLNV